MERSANAANSVGINEMWKRKREMMENEDPDGKERVEPFKRSKKRSTTVGGESEGIESLLKEMRELGREMEVKREVKGQGKKVREELAKVREEMRKG